MGCRPDASTWDNDRHPAARYPRWVLYRLDESLKQDAFEGTTQAAARTRFHNASIGYYLDPAPGGRNPASTTNKGSSSKPSVGLEPTTPSLPWKCSTS